MGLFNVWSRVKTQKRSRPLFVFFVMIFLLLLNKLILRDFMILMTMNQGVEKFRWNFKYPPRFSIFSPLQLISIKRPKVLKPDHQLTVSVSCVISFCHENNRFAFSLYIQSTAINFPRHFVYMKKSENYQIWSDFGKKSVCWLRLSACEEFFASESTFVRVFHKSSWNNSIWQHLKMSHKFFIANEIWAPCDVPFFCGYSNHLTKFCCFSRCVDRAPLT